MTSTTIKSPSIILPMMVMLAIGIGAGFAIAKLIPDSASDNSTKGNDVPQSMKDLRDKIESELSKVPGVQSVKIEKDSDGKNYIAIQVIDVTAVGNTWKYIQKSGNSSELIKIMIGIQSFNAQKTR